MTNEEIEELLDKIWWARWIEVWGCIGFDAAGVMGLFRRGRKPN